ncbi:MAG TPA: hypothetical protein VFA33_14175 [Bryobacteraceae bacterium]|nr:hypothetical protein [Bryobacteraceae bacterium]
MLLLAAASSLFLLSCSRQVQTAAPRHPDPRFLPLPPASRDADDVGRFLAGLPGTPGSPFTDLEQEEAWRVHRAELDRAWSRVAAGMLPGMRQFQARELGRAGIGRSLVFYPFSGPDALMITVFFPDSPVYVMVGLEPAGTLPTRRQFRGKELAAQLAKERETVDSELQRSFFITRQMDRQFRGQVTDGLFVPILHLLLRSGHTVTRYRYVRLNEQGEVIERAASYHAPGKIGNKGVEIDFRADNGGPEHRLFYFSVNLSNERLRQDPAFLAFLESFAGCTTFFKATSYMTHQPEFSIIREQVLAHSAAVLQDDSGIPFRFLDTPSWQVQLFGDYTRPYGSFRWLEQPDLRKAYGRPDVKPLSFRIGYGFSRVPSNLLLATAESEPRP